MRIAALLLTLWTLAMPAFAQRYPDYTSTTVNDFADLLTDADEAALAQRLSDLRRDTGVEMTVVTLRSQDDYAPGQTIETFATGLFNDWGIGDAERNDGVLVLVLPRDRAMRIELGRAYGRSWDGVARHVVETQFLPAFSQGDYPRGIARGSAAVIEQIVLPFRDGAPAAETPSDEGDFSPVWMILLFGLAALVLSGRNRIADALARFRTCPQCGQRGGLRQTRETRVRASRRAKGSGMIHMYCLHCDYRLDTPFTIARLSGGHSGGGGFGGGSSGGGGATGRW